MKKERVHEMSERELTREYMRTLKDVYKQEGILAATGYELKSFFSFIRKTVR